MRDDDFNLEYRRSKKRVLDHAVTNLLQATGDAVITLRDIMIDNKKPPSSRVACAKTILDIAINSVELNDMMSRVEKIEAPINK